MSAGHNSGVIGTELDSFLQRIERLTDEKAVQAAEYAEAISEVWAEAKSRGYTEPDPRDDLSGGQHGARTDHRAPGAVARQPRDAFERLGRIERHFDQRKAAVHQGLTDGRGFFGGQTPQDGDQRQLRERLCELFGNGGRGHAVVFSQACSFWANAAWPAQVASSPRLWLATPRLLSAKA